MNKALVLSITLLLLPRAHAVDWPHWLGPTGDSVWQEKGVISDMPSGGLITKWEQKIGYGYSGPSVANGKVYVMDYLLEGGEIANNAGAPDQLSGIERVLCFDAETGKVIWVHAYKRDYLMSYGGGPRCTPTVADGKVYALGAEGDFFCFDTETGQVIWSKQFGQDYGAKTPIWGHAAHPLVYQDILYCIVGGENSVVVAFDKNTGEERWRSIKSDNQGYCPPTIISHDGIEQLIIWHPESVNGLNPKTGEIYWSEALRPNFGGSIQAPRKRGSLLFVGGPGVASLFRLVTRNGKPGVEQVWQGNPRNAVYPVNSPILFTENALYGVDSGTGALISVNPKDGSRFWETAEPVLQDPTRRGRHGTAFLTRIGSSDTYFILNEAGDLILSQLTPAGYKEIGRTHVIDPTNTTNAGGTRTVLWSQPAFADKTLFVRNDEKITAIDLNAMSYRN